jgi:hypothetical protein
VKKSEWFKSDLFFNAIDSSDYGALNIKAIWDLPRGAEESMNDRSEESQFPGRYIAYQLLRV